MSKLTSLQYEELRKLSSISERKDKLQEFGINEWVKTKRSYFLYTTGTGKTIQLVKLMQYCENKIEGFTSHVVVPSTTLVKQFEEECKRFGLKNVSIYTINKYASICKNVKCDLLCVDELHRVCNKEALFFSKVIPEAHYKLFVGATATLDNTHKRFLQQHKINVGLEFDIFDSEDFGFVPKYMVYNLGVEMEVYKRTRFIEIVKRMEHIEKTFSPVVKGDMFFFMKMLLKFKASLVYDDVLYRDSKHFIEKYLTPELNKVQEYTFTSGQIIGLSLQHKKLSEEKLSLTTESGALKQEIVRLCRKYDTRKIIVVVGRKERANEIATLVGGLPYHSGIKNAEENKKKYISGECRIIVSCKLLSTGFDDSKTDMVIRIPEDSKEISHVQVRGRMLRIDLDNEHKYSHMINIYVRDVVDGEGNIYETPHKIWLRLSTRKDTNIKWITNINEIVND